MSTMCQAQDRCWVCGGEGGFHSCPFMSDYIEMENVSPACWLLARPVFLGLVT